MSLDKGRSDHVGCDKGNRGAGLGRGSGAWSTKDTGFEGQLTARPARLGLAEAPGRPPRVGLSRWPDIWLRKN